MRLKGEVTRTVLPVMAAGWLVTVAMVAPQKATTPKLNYSRDILPILSDKCFKCHGPDSSSRMAGMRLDTAQGAFADRGGRWPIVPGKPKDSLVVKRINLADDPMPPADSGKSLSKAEVAKITEWIKEGAEYDKLWSFEALPATVKVPPVKGQWPTNDIDRFVLARMQKAGLQPSPPASKDRLLRRVTLDLTGLPPTEKEIADFQADKRPDAYQRVVDRLLASPHFGERAAVDWLDAARYSDSYGYQSDLLMPTWPYRDWVIKAFNENMPYDKFLTDQLAGDLLKSPTRDEILATAFNRLHRQSNEGGSIAEDFKNEYAVDRVSTFGTAVLGLTVGCARCHDHKFDPISQKEFYQLYAYFNSINEYGLLLSTEIVPTPSLLLPTPEQEPKLKLLRTQSNDAQDALAKTIASAQGRYDEWLATNPKQLEIPGVLASLNLDTDPSGKFVNKAPGKAFGEKLGDPQIVPGRNGKAVQFDGDNGIAVRGLPGKERWDSFTWSFWIQDPRPTPAPIVLMHRTGGTDVGFCGFDMMLEDGFLTARVMRHWPGNAVGVRTKSRIAKNEWTHIAWSWDGSGHAAGLKIYLDGHPAQTTVVNDRLWKTINAYGDLGPSSGDWSFAQRFREAGFKGGKLADITFADRPLSPIEVEQLYDGKSLDHASTPALLAYFVAAIDPVAKQAREQVMKSQMALAQFEDGINEISVMQEANPPIPAYLLARGAYDAPKNAKTLVRRDVPQSLPPLPKDGRDDRLTLARWVTQPNHPLTARVAANRLWQMVFGVGLVETSENFGVQGSRPTNPELLDYLARRFVNSGWNVKALVREIVLSSTYRQDSSRTPKLMKADPENHLLARGPSQRLTAEMIRDTALAASGLLNPKEGGPPVNPYQPAGIWTENNTMSPGFVQSKGADLYRRSIYSTWKRTTPVPSMMLFDATSREACTMRRQSTNTPLQALVLLNDVQFVEAARVLAERVEEDKTDDQTRIKTIFLRLAGREPNPRETSILLETLREQRKLFDADPKSASKFVAEGDSKPQPDLKPAEVAAMTVTVQTAMNSDAVVWKR
jgi:hypothetical protein